MKTNLHLPTISRAASVAEMGSDPNVKWPELLPGWEAAIHTVSSSLLL